jgi:peptidyl-prolyl cis-trans isomerase B (cyclophilin B)
LARRRARQRQRNVVVAAVVVVLLLLGGGAYGFSVLAGGDSTATAKPSATPSPQAIACNGAQPPPAKTTTYKTEPKVTIDKTAKYTMLIQTSCGDITVALEAAKAPRTVNLINFLSGKQYYDGSFCPRSTGTPTLIILQCGDPQGAGTGGMDFTMPEENLTGAKYVKGVMAMTKASAPHTSGSGFFLVDRDSVLQPDFTVVGHITKGLDVLDRIIAIGQDGSSDQGDGAPLQKIYLEKVTVTKSKT